MKFPQRFLMASVVLLPWSTTHAIELNKDFTLSLEAGIYSDYRSRGLSQTQGDPAVQGSVVLSHSSGLYAGVWTSNVDFGHGSTTRQEIDYFAGYNWQVTDDLSLDAAYYEYKYPNQAGFNYSEYFAKVKAYIVYFGGYYANDLGGDQSMLYSFIGYENTLPQDIGLNVRYGKVDYKDDVIFSGHGGARDNYKEWQVALNKEFVGLNWSASYVDADLSKTECFNQNGFDDVCSPTLVVGVSKSF
jgi:uncharacterized protein (TIGR02001 family)